MLVTKKGNPLKPPRVLIYGVEGVGKSTFGAKSENPIFITPEGGVDQLRTASGDLVDEMPGIDSWEAIRGAVRKLLTEKHEFKTVVLDSADWIEKVCHARIIGTSGKSITTCNGGYGAGYRQSEIMHKELIEDISLLRERRGMNIIVTAHAHVKEVKDPSMSEDYEAFEIKCHEFVSSLWREWVDALLFVRFQTFVKSSEDTKKARAFSDGSRMVYCLKQPSFQAKNRYGLTDEVSFTENYWDQFIIEAKRSGQTNLGELKAEIDELYSKIGDEELKAKVLDSIKKAGDNTVVVSSILKRLKELTKGAA